ncbi:MAG: LuxR C-terminal-related transcriptional regulator [Solirubrobacteraceae bacterium]
MVVVEEREMIRRGLIACLEEDHRLDVATADAEEPLSDGVDIAVVSVGAAQRRAFPCPIVICGHSDAVPGATVNRVVGMLHRDSLTSAQLRATVYAAVAGLQVHVNGANGSNGTGLSAAGPLVLESRDWRVLHLLANGLSTREIAEEVNYSERTIKKVIVGLEEFLDARNRTHAVAEAMRRGLI